MFPTVVRFTTSLIVCACIMTVLNGCLKGMARASHNSNIAPATVQSLKGKTAVFILPASENAWESDYAQMLGKAWTLTPIEVVRYENSGPYFEASEKYAFFSISAEKTTVTNSSGGSYSNTHYYLALALPRVVEKKGKAKVTSDELCRIELYPDMKTTVSWYAGKQEGNLYPTAIFRNFHLPYMMAYLRFVQKNLENNKNPWVYENYADAALREKLRRDTLYVPDSLMYDRNKFNGKEELKDRGFFKAYNGIYKYVSTQELVTIMKNRNPSKPLFLFEYVLSSTDKYVGVLDINSGAVVYRKYTPVTYNIKPKDLKGIIE